MLSAGFPSCQRCGQAQGGQDANKQPGGRSGIPISPRLTRALSCGRCRRVAPGAASRGNRSRLGLRRSLPAQGRKRNCCWTWAGGSARGWEAELQKWAANGCRTASSSPGLRPFARALRGAFGFAGSSAHVCFVEFALLRCQWLRAK